MPFAGDRFNLYRALRQVNPSPYLFYLDVDGLDDGGAFTLVGSSPEVLARVEPRGPDRRALVLPIAGTRRRGATPDEDDAHAARPSLADPKERAEHLMLVDLGRNDLCRVSETGTVSVDRFAEVERFSHVMHLVSSVSGAVADRQATDILAACFPAGTVSGAPKVRAMEIIDELESVRRGSLRRRRRLRRLRRRARHLHRHPHHDREGRGGLRPGRRRHRRRLGPGRRVRRDASAKAAALFAAMRSATSDLL